MRKGLPVNEDGNEITHEENDWAITPTTVYIPGRISDDNLHSLVELSEKKSKVDSEKSILFPGITLVYLNLDDAF
jgi:hypothetical protein